VTASPAPAGVWPGGPRPGGGHEIVTAPDRCPATAHGERASIRTLIPPRQDSPLSLALIEIEPGGSAQLGADPSLHELAFVLEGGLTLRTAGAAHAVGAESAFLHDGADGGLTVSAGDAGARLVVFGVGSEADEHAALGPRTPSVALDLVDAGSATGKRSFQVLLGPENGCCRATMFLGAVPPGAAPWHFHQYDEIVYTVSGGGTYHQAEGTQPTGPGSAVRITPRTVHINENGTESDMHVLGVFTPAGSPSAAFLAGDPRPSAAAD
jgi:quercetin dioxygenase-like cupin family protein